MIEAVRQAGGAATGVALACAEAKQRRELDPGELQRELQARAARRYRPPGARASRPFHWKTLQTWYYQAKDGLDGLTPASRARGHALALDDDQRELLLDMRREHRSASIELILAEAVRTGAIPEAAVSEATLRRLYRDHDLGRDSQNRASRRERRRWQAERPCALWHADVCHVWLRDPDGKAAQGLRPRDPRRSRPLRRGARGP